MIRIGDKTILEHQINTLKKFGINDIHVITGYGKDKFNISAYGDVYPCTYVFLKFGDATKEPLRDILERMRSFKYFKGFTTDCTRCDNKEFIKKYIDTSAMGDDMIHGGGKLS